MWLMHTSQFYYVFCLKGFPAQESMKCSWCKQWMYQNGIPIQPLSYQGGYLKFNAQFMKNILFEQKKIKLLKNSTLWKN
jgi:hypothetical protein